MKRIYTNNSILIILMFLFCINNLQAQKVDTKGADELFKAKNYQDALKEYVELFKKNIDNDYVSYQVGLCYLNLNEDRSIAINFLEPLIKKETAKAANYFYLAKAYTYANKYQEALENFEKAKSKGSIDGVDNTLLEREIQQCKNALELVSKPIQVTFENLGPRINTVFTEFSPYISNNESFLIYNSKNDVGGVKKADATYTSDVYISEVYMGEWQPSKNIGDIVNTKANDEQIVGVSADGLTLLFNIDNATDGAGDIYVGPKYENEIMKPFKINSTVNSTNSERGATISPDGRTLYFSSNRPGGFGGYDIYRSLVLPDGSWSEGLNLGAEVNTVYDDDYPNMSMDGNTIYFSSKGHNSMGGYDIFKTNLDIETGKWSKAENLGFPLNDAYDNLNLCMSSKGRYGYVSAMRPEGYGDLDLYRVTFGNVDAELSVVKGKLSSADNSKTISGAAIVITNAETGSLIGEYMPTKANRFCIILPPGKYKLMASANNHEEFVDYVTVLGKGSFENSIDKDIVLQSKK